MGRVYNAAEVDVFMAHARWLSAKAIREVQFEASRKHAYEMDAVDAALDRLEIEARARELEA